MATENITEKNIIKSWFKRGLKPLELQFHAWMDSYWHKSEKIPTSSVENLETVLNNKAEEANVTELGKKISEIETAYKAEDTKLENTIREETARAMAAEDGKVDKEVDRELMPSPSPEFGSDYYLTASGEWKKVNPNAKVITMTVDAEGSTFNLDRDELLEYLKAYYEVEDFSLGYSPLHTIPGVEAYFKYAPYGVVNGEEGKVDDILTVWHYLKVIWKGTEYGTPKLEAYEFLLGSSELDVTKYYCSVGVVQSDEGAFSAEVFTSDIKKFTIASGNDINNLLDGKVDKVEGKQLSAEDYSTAEKAKLGFISEYVEYIEIENAPSNEDIRLRYNIVYPDEQTRGLAAPSIPVVTDSHNGVVSPRYKRLLDGLSSEGKSLDVTGTPSDTWHIGKPSGVVVKKSGNVLEVRNSADSGYADVTLNGLTVKGNMVVEGESFVVNAQTVETADNVLLLNRGEVGAGVTKGIAGLEIDRGTQENYKIVFDESDDRFKAGVGDDQWPLMLRDNEVDLSDGLFLAWDNTTKRAKTTNTVPLGQSLNFSTSNGNSCGIHLVGDNLTFKGVGSKRMSLDFSVENTVRFRVSNPGNNGKCEFTASVLGITFRRSSDGAEVAYKNDIDSELAKYVPLAGNEDHPMTGDLFVSYNNGITFKDSNNVNQGVIVYGNAEITNLSSDYDLNIFGNINNGRVIINSKNDIYRHYYGGLNEVKAKIWDESNDGANSGLDADLLDGKQGSEYALKTDIPALSGYATQDWVNANTVTITGPQTITGAKTFSSAVVGTAGFYDTSDRRLKKDIKPVELKLEKIKLYEFDKNGKHSYGVIAQDIEDLYPSTVQNGDDGYKIVNYNEILIIKCAELDAENFKLRERLDKLEKQLTER